MQQNRVQSLVWQWDHIWEKEEWIAPVTTVLEGIPAASAAWVPQGGGNSIWETLNHMNYHNERRWLRLNGQEVGPKNISNEETFRGHIDPEDEEGWQAVVTKARTISAGLREALGQLTEEQLDAPYASTSLTLGQELLNWIMHDAYHAGQIVLIRKQLGVWRQ
ncbi:DinB family protein [Paenibacillus terrigena]|uniref:DinB family protein n=1 Tax=Paenibacillus terrigena TaxID=369333 RepID=UPI000369B56B|nr:DinB family protein [Paenibacillus terrigena]